MASDEFVRSDGVKIPLLTEPYCQVCSSPIHPDYADFGYCYFCNPKKNSHLRPEIVVRSVEFYLDDDFDHRLSNEIRKFKVKKTSAPLLAECLLYVLKEKFPELLEADLIIPILKVDPSRGYNQAALLAEIISKETGIPYVDCLYAVEPFSPLRGKSLKEREQIVADKIGCKIDVKGKIILLIDDVYTTGATMRECGWVLSKAGANNVHGIVLGRATDKKALKFTGRIP